MDKKILQHFKKVDPILYHAYMQLADQELMTIHVPTDHFSALCREIIGQQLSTKVARVIFERFKNLFPKKQITATYLIGIKQEALRAIGMSNSKAQFLLDLAQKVENKEISFAKLQKLDDEGVIRELVQVKGIGPWTAEMFLIFSLGREDVFSFGDLGLKNAIKKIYGLTNATNADIAEIVIKWSPYKSYACRILWKSLG
jgi:DNA-3-methyladenine glycosylase II